MLTHKSIWTVKPCRINIGLAMHEDTEQESSGNKSCAGQIEQETVSNLWCNMDTDVNVNVIDVDWEEVILSNSMGFARLVRYCDDKTLNILFEKRKGKGNASNNIVLTDDSFVELSGVKKQESSFADGGDVYHFQAKTITDYEKMCDGYPDSFFLTQIYNKENCNSVTMPNDKKQYQQIFSARGMYTTSLHTQKIIPDCSYWTFCRRCDTTFDFSKHSPGDYKNILINSKLLCIIAWDSVISPQFNLSFRRIKGRYLRRYDSYLIRPSANLIGCDTINNMYTNYNNTNYNNNSNANLTQFGFSLDNDDVFGFNCELSNVVFDCVLLDNVYDNYNNKNTLTLMLICKALPYVNHLFEFIKIKVTFSNEYKNLLSCWYQRDTNVSINNNLNLKRLLNNKNECLLGWNDETTGFKTECIKINSQKWNKNNCNDRKHRTQDNVVSDTKNRTRLLIIVIKTFRHYIILYNCDLNNHVILKLNCIANVNTNKLFPYVCVCCIIVMYRLHFCFVRFCFFRFWAWPLCRTEFEIACFFFLRVRFECTVNRMYGQTRQRLACQLGIHSHA